MSTEFEGYPFINQTLYQFVGAPKLKVGDVGWFWLLIL